MKNKYCYDGVEYDHEIASSQGEENVFKWSAKTLLKCITVVVVTKQLFYYVYIIPLYHTAFLKNHVMFQVMKLAFFWHAYGSLLASN